MNPRAFYETVKAMRAAQLKAASCKSEYWNRETARLESIIDGEIERVEEILRQKEEPRQKVGRVIDALNARDFGLEKVSGKP